MRKRFFGSIISPSTTTTTKVQSKTERNNKCSTSPLSSSKSIITRSKSCQSTCRLKPVLKNSNSNKPIVDRCWWIESESDIPCIVDDENNLNGLIQQRPHSAMMNEKWRLANNNNKLSSRMTFSGRSEDVLMSTIGSRSNASTTGTLNSFLLVRDFLIINISGATG
ncbi:unnamed protein product [Meloidogyne enterolobii]|uniref:Uncharacterized protein n=1 Tax=Meloidogyne enterolobii TaxID=390850 RepID=A0ACB0YX53_MELEN